MSAAPEQTLRALNTLADTPPKEDAWPDVYSRRI